MEVTAKKYVSEQQEQQIMTEAPSTPKKKPKYAFSQHSSVRRIKSFTQIKQKQSVSLIYLLLVFIWIVIAAYVVFMAVETKTRAAEAQAEKEISQCKLDFENNRCTNPVKGLVTYCNQKIICLNQTAVERVEKSLSHSKLFGEIVSEFAQGAGLVGLLVGLGLIGLCLRQKGRIKETVTLQFFEDK